jgi:hypothetical protein
MQPFFFFRQKGRDFVLLCAFGPLFWEPEGKPESREKDADARKFVSGGPFPARKRLALHRIARQIVGDSLREEGWGWWHELGCQRGTTERLSGAKITATACS